MLDELTIEDAVVAVLAAAVGASVPVRAVTSVESVRRALTSPPCVFVSSRSKVVEEWPFGQGQHQLREVEIRVLAVARSVRHDTSGRGEVTTHGLLDTCAEAMAGLALDGINGKVRVGELGDAGAELARGYVEQSLTLRAEYDAVSSGG